MVTWRVVLADDDAGVVLALSKRDRGGGKVDSAPGLCFESGNHVGQLALLGFDGFEGEGHVDNL